MKSQWYRQQAEIFGEFAGAIATIRPWPAVKSPRALEHNRMMVAQHYQNARIAGHFGLLALALERRAEIEQQVHEWSGQPVSVDAVDPSAADPGTPTTRKKSS